MGVATQEYLVLLALLAALLVLCAAGCWASVNNGVGIGVGPSIREEYPPGINEVYDAIYEACPFNLEEAEFDPVCTGDLPDYCLVP